MAVSTSIDFIKSMVPDLNVIMFYSSYELILNLNGFPGIIFPKSCTTILAQLEFISYKSLDLSHLIKLTRFNKKNVSSKRNFTVLPSIFNPQTSCMDIIYNKHKIH